MKPEELDDFDEEEFEMIINGLIHPGDMFTPPDFMTGFPGPVGAVPGAGMPGSFPGGPNLSGIDNMIASAYDEMEDEPLAY